VPPPHLDVAMAPLILAWPGALAIGLSLGLMGSGGSILTVPVLVYLVGQDEKLAIASSLAIVAVIAAAGSLAYVHKRLVDWRHVLLFGMPGVLGTYLGAWASQFVAGSTQLVLFAVVMLVASFMMLKPLEAVDAAAPPRTGWKIGLDGAFVGTITGFVGVGGGFLVVPALVLLGGLAIPRAVGTSLVIISINSSTGFLKHLDLLQQQGIALDVQVIFVISLIGVLGSIAGTRISGRLPQARLKQYFGIFLIATGAFILWRSMPALIAA